MTEEDVRFTVKGKTLYAFVTAHKLRARIKALAAKGTQQPVKVRTVEILGHKSKLKWVQGDMN